MAPKFVPRQRKHKVLARRKAAENARHEVPEDTNQVILPSQDDRQARKQALKDELRQEGEKMSGKKAKRFEKYIDNKLRKDETRDLLAKLAKQETVDTSLLSSSRALGRGKETKRQSFARALKEREAGLAGDDEDVLFEKRKEIEEDDAETAGDNETAAAVAPVATKAAPLAEPTSTSETQIQNLGTGLKRPLDVDDEGRPVIPKRRKRGGVKSKVSTPSIAVPAPETETDNGDEWTGFSVDEASTKEKDSERTSEDDEDGSEDDAGSDSEGSEESSEDDDDNDEDEPKESRSSAFKAWATAQRNEAQGFKGIEESTTNMVIPKPDNFTPRAPEQDPLPQELQPTKVVDRKTYAVPVTRTPDIQDARLKLPVVAEEQRLMEAIYNNHIVVICGATGSGKTTQVPQFLFEAGYGSVGSDTPGMIGVTQPRRVAAVSMSKRVGDELGDHGHKVAYQIRFEGTTNPDTAVKFMTDGVLLREVAEDLALRKYSAIIIDEAHERSVNTDILIGMLSRVIKLRTELAQEDPKLKPLKLIIMSATLRVEDLTMNSRLFENPPPVIEVEGRQHPVTVHFARRTTSDYVEEAFRKISRGHKKLPPGGFLVFLTGRNEITQLSKQLKAAFGGLKTAEAPRVRLTASEAPTEVEDIEFGDVDDGDADDMDSLPSEDEDEEADEDEFKIEDDQEAAPMKMQVLPLYSLLPTKDQLRVFEPPPEGTRQIILATNVAETSLTIPGTRYVFDCGRAKERQYDPVTGVQSFEVGWISKASASQRSGRAGRTGPGHCYRLYSSAVYERDFQQYADPELLRMPLEGVALQLKAMNLTHVVNFPFPTPPDRRILARSEKVLHYLSAISTTGRVTEVGTAMSVFPLAPRFARILLVGHMHGCIHYTIAMVAALSAQELFLPDNQAVPALAESTTEFRSNSDIIAETKQAEMRKRFNEVHKNFCYLDDRADAIKLLQVVGEFAHEPFEAWCDNHFVRFKVLKEIQQLRRQITDLLRNNIDGFGNLRFEDKLDPPMPKQVAALKQMAAAGFIDQVAIRGDLAPTPPETHRPPRRPIDVPYLPLTPLVEADEADRCVYIHPSSPMSHLSVQECPQFIVYSHLQKATQSANVDKKPKTRMHALTDITGGQLSVLAKGTPLLTYGKPVKEFKAEFDKTDGLMVRECAVIPYLRAEGTGGQGWALPMKKVKQKKIPGKGWTVI
ncbi:uncharacterized protein J7T54_001278 [Emericellopsis cladophorae]|uniref:RNA helicase n=1 Tax=Emericellopsis cladophorae TaxID=2686198 RepID=A0A9Q0BF13_9HYPO|nr:uncharacterized protein J7T54_001278 [Emericellopsis cladophorae]KAI6782421.1 hypothetical protein J7T54_001278 [Emericellopsis cladophorae]